MKKYNLYCRIRQVNPYIGVAKALKLIILLIVILNGFNIEVISHNISKLAN